MTSIRTFISIPIEGKGSMKPMLEDLSAVGGVRCAPVGQLHITLRFVGDVDASRIDRMERCVRSAVEGVAPFEITVSGAGAFPNRGRPSVVWIGASPQDILAGMADRMGRELDSAGIDYDGKPFKSHVTVGRCRGPADLSGFFDRYGGTEFTRFVCSHVDIMGSELTPRGAVHRVLRRIDLRSPSETDLLRASRRSRPDHPVVVFSGKFPVFRIVMPVQLRRRHANGTPAACFIRRSDETAAITWLPEISEGTGAEA